nr:GIY-YIG nuclease family protein [Oceanococcus sp. HetDA_MAG_MS8]
MESLPEKRHPSPRLPGLSRSGVYRIQCDEDFYIGSALDIRKRKNSHFRDLNLKSHRNLKLQRAYLTSAKVTFAVVEFCDADARCAREQHYIDTLSPTLNISEHAENTMQTPEILERISGVNNYNAKNSEAELEAVLLKLVETGDLDEVVSATGVSRHVVADISSGKSHKWLARKMPEEYRTVRLQHGMKRLTVERVEQILRGALDGRSKLSLAQQFDVDRNVITHVLDRTRNYAQKLYSELPNLRQMWIELDEKRGRQH